jgi:ACT domain-containing protein
MTKPNYIKIHRDKRQAAGQVRVEVWVHQTNKDEIKAVAKSLKEQGE